MTLSFDDGSADHALAADLLSARGMRGTFFVVSERLTFSDSLSLPQLLAMQAAGHEIGGHTMGHVDLVTLDEVARLRQLCQSRYDLMATGLAVRSFAYPFGSPKRNSPELPGVQDMLRACGYNAARGSGDLYAGSSCSTCPAVEDLPPVDPYHIKSVSSIKSSMMLSTLQDYVTRAEQAGGGWWTIVLHRICDGCSDNALSPALFGEFLDWLAGEVAANRVSVKTMAEVIGGALRPAVPGPPRILPPPGSNLLPNSSLELDLNHDQIPDCWQRAGSGTSSAVYTLTSTTHSGSVAQQIEVTDYVSGGRRLLVSQDATNCAPLATPGFTYHTSAWYTATAEARFSAFVLDAGDKWSYFAQSPVLPPVEQYTQASWVIPTLPAGTQALTVGLTLVANGQLRMDDVELRGADTTGPLVTFTLPANQGVVRGTVPVVVSASDPGGVDRVELLADGVLVGPMTASPDGGFVVDWDSTLHADGLASLQVRAWDAAGNGTTSTVSVRVANAASSNLLLNPSLELDQNGDQVPDCWQPGGSGTNSGTYSLTSVAHSGAVAQQIDVTSYLSGARRLVVKQDGGTCAPPAVPGHVYQTSAWYTATGGSRFTAYVLNESNVWTYLAQSPLLSPVEQYTQAAWTIPALPAGSQAISVGLSLVANGRLRMDDFELHDATGAGPN